VEEMTIRNAAASFFLFIFCLYATEALGQTSADTLSTDEAGQVSVSDLTYGHESPDNVYRFYRRALWGSGYTPENRERGASVMPNGTGYGIQRWDNKVVNPVFGAGNSRFSWTLFSPELFSSSNSEFPIGNNDGALWQGKGMNYYVRGGAGISAGPLTVVFRPVYVRSENLEFTLSSYPSFSGISEYGRPLSNIDYPQRFGEETLEEFNLGDSYIQLTARGVAAGLSNERITMGPAIHNPVLLGANAPGFMHGYLKSDGPVKTAAGNLRGSWFWGTLQESDYFDSDGSNNLRTVTGFTVDYTPSFVEGLNVGINRIAYGMYPNGGIGASDFVTAFRLPQSKNQNNGAGDYHIMTTLYGRWVFDSAKAELYAEWGLNNNKRRIRDLLSEPEMNRGYMFGFLKTFMFSGENRLVVNLETTNLENSVVGAQFRDEANTWYEHETIRQGFTHEGQLLGAGIGPGSSGQTGRVAFFGRWGMAGVTFQRVASFYDRFFREQETYIDLYPFGEENWFMLDRFMNMWSYGADAVIFLPFNLDLRVEYQHTSIHNLYNRYQNDLDNDHIQVSVRKNFN
jgi:hypothetical protein